MSELGVLHDMMGSPAVEEEELRRERPVEILLARHPEVQANVDGRFVGTGESPFTELGERQCADLAACIAAWKPSSIHTSPRTRAGAVADLAAGMAGVAMHVDDALAEIDFGAAEGLIYDEAVHNDVEILLARHPEAAPFEDGESWHSFAVRIAEGAERIETCGPRIAVVAHGGVVRALLTHWLGLSHKAAWRFAVPNASVATITLWDGHGTLRTFGMQPGACPWATSCPPVAPLAGEDDDMRTPPDSIGAPLMGPGAG